LAARGAELDTVTKLARRALVLGEDVSLRTELSTWFAGLGEPSLAAATLRPVLPQRKGIALSRVLTRIAVLLARAGDAKGASAALREATEHAPSDPLPPELLGAVGAWAPDAFSPENAALAYVEGSRRRAQAGEKSAAFEDLLRAFEAAPQCSEAAEALHAELIGRGRAGAADEVLREHARALLDEQAHRVHLKRMRAAAEQGEYHRAVAAGLDAQLESSFDVERAMAAANRSGPAKPDDLSFERLLEEVGLFDLLAVRLDVAADSLSGSERAQARLAAARICAGKLGRPTRAVQLWMDALVSDPGAGDARQNLLRHASQTMDFAPLVEALIRVAQGSSTGDGWRVAVLELMRLAEERLSDPGLAAWAARRLVDEESEHAEASQALERLAPRVRLQNEVLKAAEAQRAQGSTDAALLARMAGVLLGRPDRAQDTLGILKELLVRIPGQLRWRQHYRLILERLGHLEPLAELLEKLAREAHSPEKEAMVLDRARLARARGDHAAALSCLRPWLAESNTHAEVSALALVLATKVGDDRARGEALVRMSSSLGPPLRATLMSVAVEALLAAGDTQAAVELSEQACHADPSRTRPVAARALAVADTDEPDQAALERAVGVVVPRTNICVAIANAYEHADAPLLALAWTQRQLALRPGDLSIAKVLLERVVKAGDASRLSDALAWLLSQPEPLNRLAPAVAQALRALCKLDSQRAVALARRSLDVMGPGSDELREAILEVADAAFERGLAIAVTERWLASGAPGELRAEGLMMVARRRSAAGDADGAARALWRALKEGAEPSKIDSLLSELSEPRGSDGILALLEVRAEVQSATHPDDFEKLAKIWREVGAARWDLAQDKLGAFTVWEHAASLDPESGYSRLAADLLNFAGADAALEELQRLAGESGERGSKARLLSVAAGVALEAGRLADAMSIGARALEIDPSRTDVLAIVERSAHAEDVEALDNVYYALADRSLGVYGTRAAHYRAARQMEQRKQPERAFAHALKAFQAVPNEGVAFVMLARLVQGLGRASELTLALEKVAQESADKTQRSRWLKRAAAFADASSEGARQRLDVLLRALAVSADLETLKALGEAVAAVLSFAPEEQEVVELRYERALRSIFGRAGGYSGALLLIHGAKTAARELSAIAVAHEAILQAIECDPSVTEYSSLLPAVPSLAQAVEPAAQLVSKVVALAEEAFSGAGPELIELGAELALALSNQHAAARLLVAAAERRPEDRELVLKAEKLAHRVGDKALLEQVLSAVPIRERLAGLLAIADQCEQQGELEQAIDAFKRASELEGLQAEDYALVQERLTVCYRLAGHHTALELLLQARLAKDDLTPDVRVGISVELAALLGTAGRAEQALAVLIPVARERQDLSLLRDMAALAQQAGDRRVQAEALDLMADHQATPEARLELLKELCSLLDELGDEQAALRRYREVLSLSPNDSQALSAMERDAERRADYEGLVEILERRASSAVMVDDVRRIHLHRAMVLEQRLARPEDARAELEALLASIGDHLSVLRVLADLDERLGDASRAAALWLRASAIAKTKEEAAELAFKSCEAQLSAGDVGAARRVLEGVEGWAQNLRWRELKVEVERRSEDPFALGHAVEELALGSDEGPERRAALLVEAAQIALAAGDQKQATRRVSIATRLAPGNPEAQLMKQSFDYRERGVGDADTARLVVAELRGLEGELSEEQEELRGFLLAEALDVSLGAGAGLDELEGIVGRLGPRPLLALGIAERALAKQEYERAQRFFERALAGDLKGLRRQSAAALSAATTARALGNQELALAFAETAGRDPELREQVAELVASVHQSLADEKAPAAQEPEPEMGAPTRRSSAPVLGAASDRPTPEVEVRHALSAARQRAHTLKSEPLSIAEAAEAGSAEASSAAEASAAEAGTAETSSAVEASAAEMLPDPREPEASVPPLAYSRETAEPDPASEIDSSERALRRLREPVIRNLDDAEAGEDSEPPDSVAAMRALAEPKFRQSMGAFVAPAPDEQALLKRMLEGDEQATRELISRLESKPERTLDLVSACRRLVKLKPGDTWALKRLHEAASRDGNVAYAMAVEHVLGLFDSYEPVAPPSLKSQPEHPDAVRAMLFRDNHTAGGKALKIVWEGASHVFRRDPSTYGVTGLERVPLGAPTPLARAYSEAARAMGLTRTPMFQRRSVGSVTVSLALLSPPALILSGDVQEDTPTLRFYIGSMLASAWSEHVLLFGAGEGPIRSVLQALLIAFGPPRTGKNPQAVANLAEVLWESIPASGQRQLRQLCDRPELIEYQAVAAAARRVQRRAGLYCSGDFGLSLRQLMLQENLGHEPPKTLDQFAVLCAKQPSVADLVRLATSPEYAEVRWQRSQASQLKPVS
jgi:hypothetical protein